MPNDAMVSTDIGNVCSVSNSYLQFDGAPRFLAAMSFGNCGYAYPAAIGAKVGRPGPSGDRVRRRRRLGHEHRRDDDRASARASRWWRSCSNNRQWGAEKKNQIDYFDNRFVGTNLENPNFAEVARAMGAEGIRISHQDQVGDALKAAVASGKPTVIDLLLTRELGEPFRRDAFKQPVRMLDKYSELSAKA